MGNTSSKKKTNPCENAIVKKRKPGTHPEDWPNIKILLDIIFKDGGPGFPDGVFFTTKAGGLPKPDKKAKAGLDKIFDELVKEGQEKKVDLCSDDAVGLMQAAGFKILNGDESDPITKYLSKNCRAIIKVLEGNHCFLSANSGKALMRALVLTKRHFKGKIEQVIEDALVVLEFMALSED